MLQLQVKVVVITNGVQMQKHPARDMRWLSLSFSARSVKLYQVDREAGKHVTGQNKVMSINSF